MAKMRYGQIIEDRKLIKKEPEKGKLRMLGLKSTIKRRMPDGKVVKQKVPRQYQGSWTLNLDETTNHDFDHIYYFTELFVYRIDKKKAYEKGTFKVLGGEKKLVIPCKHFDVEER